MDSKLKKELERIFREASSSGELFDSFQKAIRHKLKDAELYKILLSNIMLSPDEIKMYTEKLCTEYRDICYEIYMWAANILESMHAEEHLETAFEYYRKAIEANRKDCQPYISMVKMYNTDLDMPPKKVLLELLKRGIDEVQHKSRLCRTIAEFYELLQDKLMRQKYLAMAAKFARSGM
ncbi:MAG: hypothetical protein HF314_10410 [Ignavibacteria bacterium]|jgi:tetratricopeptide (TPR) repeat protein|nr:hypothetical protein [Ignavibacteria bacterium]MCU7503478.1 hypothetical protein [Ignavibacteria bacterium]MCU7516190.1 hypothetical protein [Ignavibacteria bacterium]